MTTAQSCASDDLNAALSNREQALNVLDANVEAKQGELRARRDAAAKSERRLLTSQGAELVAAVIDALQSFGFKVKKTWTTFMRMVRSEKIYRCSRLSVMGGSR